MTRILITAIATAAIATASMAQNKEKVLLKIGDNNISINEFNYIYNKNNSAAQLPISKNEYLELFIAYKLKVAEGKSLGIDQTEQYKNECNSYYNILIPPYQTDSAAQKQAETELANRLKQEVNASHILIEVPLNASPTDTLAAYKKAIEARNEILAGANFNEVARRISDDKSAQYNGGNLDWFSALQMVEPFETVAYETPINSISDVFRTMYGYHFIKVNDRQKFPPQIRIAHIMKRFKHNNTSTATDSLRHITDSLRTALLNGADFAHMAATESDDKQSAQHGGLMPWITTHNIPSDISEFATHAFALAHDGDISEVFKTKYGWHIIKRIELRNERPNDEIIQIIDYAKQKGHPIAQAGTTAYAKHLLTEYALKWNTDVLQQVTDIKTSNHPDSLQNELLKNITKPLATYQNGKEILAIEVQQHWNPRATLAENYATIAQNILLDYDRQNLVNKFDDLRYMMQEYYDGLIVYEINKRTIWNNADIDLTQLQQLYNDNKQRYAKGATFNGTIYFCNDKKTAQKVKAIATKNPKKAAQLASHTISGEQHQGGIYDDILWPNITSEYTIAVGSYTEGEVQPFSSIKGQVTADIQQRKEIEYVKQLWNKYNPKIVGKIK